MTIKTILLSGLSLALLSAPAMAQGGKPGERLLNDERVPEAPQLKKRIFKEPRKVINKKVEETPEPPSTDVHRDIRGDDEKRTGDASDSGDDDVKVNVEIDPDDPDYDADDVADDIEDLKEELDQSDADVDNVIYNRGDSDHDDHMSIRERRIERGDFPDEEIKSGPSLTGEKLKKLNDDIKKKLER